MKEGENPKEKQSVWGYGNVGVWGYNGGAFTPILPHPHTPIPLLPSAHRLHDELSKRAGEGREGVVGVADEMETAVER